MTIKPGEPNDVELRERLRKWVWHYRRKLKTQREVADTLDFSETHISHVIRGLEGAGLDLVFRLHYRFGADLNTMARFDPEDAAQAPVAEELRPRKRVARK